MSDPAIEAAQRAWGDRRGSKIAWKVGITSAREALKPIRELHTPFEVVKGGRKYCRGCSKRADLNIMWPCETAEKSYPTEELER
ncbi:Uncharacterised protein [Mycobacteroides abscessus subsp. abscessus]|uniref:hypothetical protein n=1 Tax=Mycobacteroides abscessus TaxID=36809 RepID=UPI00092781A8|nr:hypothetical protein [Mycobacteroides abscessus]SIL61168.1 Uncharacterised protein [Mycobacteroides abscessus subsp. abscessus]